MGAEQIAQFQFTALSNRSAFVPLTMGNVAATRANGTPVPSVGAQHGRVVVVGQEPLLECWRLTNGPPIITLYGQPAENYALLSSPAVEAPGEWPVVWEGPVNSLSTNFLLTNGLYAPTNPASFFRARRQ